MPEFIAPSSIPLPQPPAGWFDLGYAILSDGTLAILRAQHNIDAEYAHQKATKDVGFDVSAISNGRYMLSTFDGNLERDTIEIASVPYPLVTRLADGRWLVAATRSEPGEPNGYLYDTDGSLLSRLVLGDGISFILAAPDNTIWIGYFDEGIYANPLSNGKWPISSAGIAQLSADGNLLWSFNSENGAEQVIDDCYSLTLDGNDVWSCFYSDFPIVRIGDGKVRVWTNRLSGASAIAVEGDYVLLAGGYDDAERLALLHLDQAGTKSMRELQYPELGVSGDGLIQGHGGALNVVAGGAWSRVTVDDVRTFLADPQNRDRFKDQS